MNKKTFCSGSSDFFFTKVIFEIIFAEDRQCINCPSEWKTEKTFNSNSSQTHPWKSHDKESQVSLAKNAETQTEAKKISEVSDSQNPLQDPKFYKFISKAVPMLEAELEAARRSRAFDGYQLLESEIDAQVKKQRGITRNFLSLEKRTICKIMNTFFLVIFVERLKVNYSNFHCE